MTFICIFTFVIVCYGFSNQIINTDGAFNIYTHLKVIGLKIHPTILHLLECIICLPTWIGFFLSMLDSLLINSNFTPANIIIDHNSFIIVLIKLLIDGFFASGAVWLIHTLQNYFEVKTNYIEKLKDIEYKDKKILND